MKRFLSLLLACVMVFAVALTMASCEKEEETAGLPYGFEDTKELAAQGAVNATAPEVTGDVTKIKIGAILIGDANEGYTKAHIDGITQAAAQLGIQESQIVWKYSIPENEEVTNSGEQLIADGCNVIITNSYGHQTYALELAGKHPEVQFISMTGDMAATSGLSNLANAFTKV